MPKITEKLARKTIKFSKQREAVVGRWDKGSVFENFYFHIRQVDSERFTLRINGSDTYMTGPCMKNILEWGFKIVVSRARRGVGVHIVLNEINKAMKELNK